MANRKADVPARHHPRNGAAAPRPVPGQASGSPAPGAPSFGRTASAADYRARLALMGLTAPGEEHACNAAAAAAARVPLGREVRALVEREHQEAEQRQAARAKALDKSRVDCSTASRGVVEARRAALGLDADGVYTSQPSVIAPPPDQPAPEKRKPSPADLMERERRRVEKRASNIIGALSQGTRIDMRRLDPQVFAAVLKRRFGISGW